MLTIRNMKESDVKEIARLERESFTDAWSEKSIYDTFCQTQAFVVVAEEDEDIAGYCIVYFVMDEGEIARIAVEQNFRRQGVGRKLLDQVEMLCKEKGIAKLLLDVRQSNAAARSFYENYGFDEDGIRKDFYELPKESAILMSKTIAFGNANRD